MKDKRYIELKKENDNTLMHLSPSYKHLATIYIKKARGYAVRNIDTELKIKDVLKKLEDYDIRNVQYDIAITNETEFVESNVQLLSKQIKDPDRWKTIVVLSIIAVVLLGWLAINMWMKRDAPNQTPQNLKVEKISETSIVISWDENKFATEGYDVMAVTESGTKLGYYHTLDTSYTFLNINTNEKITFYVKTEETEVFAESEEGVIVYTPSE